MSVFRYACKKANDILDDSFYRFLIMTTIFFFIFDTLNATSRSKGEEVYRGTINGREVLYTENVSDGELNNKRNVMTIIDGGKKYTLYDLSDSTDIDWRNDRKPEFENDEVEWIVIETGEIREGEHNKWLTEFYHIDDGTELLTHFGSMSDWHPETLDERSKRDFFLEVNTAYNNLRQIIREKRRAECESQPTPLDFDP